MSDFARPVVVLKPQGENYGFQYRDPAKVVRCHNKEALQSLLNFYSYPFIKMRLPDDPAARRRYVEQVRPALRWFCKKFQTEIPQWLLGNAHYDDMPGKEKSDYFGPGDLKVFEFDQQNPIGDEGASPQ